MEFSKNPLVDKINEGIDFIAKNKKIAFYTLIGFLVFIGLSIGYFFYRAGLQKRAHSDLLKALKIYNAKVVTTVTDENLGPNVFRSEQEKWMEVDKVFSDYYKKNKTVGIAPMFLAYRVEALLNLGKLADAIDVQKQILKIIPKKSSLNDYNEIKLALMKIDSNVKEFIDQGIDLLKSVAYKEGSVAQDEALYRLGDYYWYAKNFKEAANYWNQLIIKFGKTSKYPSVWVDLIKPKLKTISA